MSLQKNHTMAFHAALYLLLCLHITIGDAFMSQKFTIGSESPPPFKAPSPNVHAQHILNLTAKAGTPQSASYLQSIRGGNHVNGVYGLTPLNYFDGGESILNAYIELGTQSFQVQIDTGSSDTWVLGEGFQCVDTTGANVSESACISGPTYTISPTFKRIPDQHFHASYADGTSVSGTFGREKVAIAGIPVQNQQIAVVDHASYAADGVSSGFIGLAFPLVTGAYAGTDPNINTNQIIYNPIVTNLFRKKHIAPVFSLAIKRTSISSGYAPGGLLAIGGLPPVRFSTSFARAPFQLVTIDFNDKPLAVPQYSFYTIIANGFTYEGSKGTNWTRPNIPSPFAPPTNPSHHHVIIDSGTLLIYLPTEIASAVNALFDPPAVYDAGVGVYIVSCSAKTPEFGIEIGEQTFFINGIDLIGPESANGNGYCASGIEDAGSSMPILGAVFLRNVLAVFDIGASEMRFAAREFY